MWHEARLGLTAEELPLRLGEDWSEGKTNFPLGYRPMQALPFKRVWYNVSMKYFYLYKYSPTSVRGMRKEKSVFPTAPDRRGQGCLAGIGAGRCVLDAHSSHHRSYS
jgi:hypothetical protein